MSQQQSIKPATVTKENLIFPVDYNDVTAVDPPSKATFCTQASITQFLTAKGATNFKHLNSVFECLPYVLQHNVTIRMAAGVHRPRPGDVWSTMYLRDKQLISNALLVVEGTTPSTWPALDPSLSGLSVIAHQVDGGDPWLDFSGTPFATFDLRGKYLVLSTGQTVVIHEHTSSRLHVLDALAPDPTGATATVARPNTEITNSIDDIASTVYYGATVQLPASFTPVTLRNIRIKAPVVGGTLGVFYGGYTSLECIEFDMDNGADGGGLNAGTWGEGAYVSTWACAFCAPTPPVEQPDVPISVQGAGSFVFLGSSYVRGWTNSICASGASVLTLSSTVIDAVADAGAVGSIQIDIDSTLTAPHFSGKRTEIRNTIAGVPGIWFLGNAKLATASGWYRWLSLNIDFKNCAGPCIRIGEGCDLDFVTVYSVSVRSLGGNTDVGIDFEGRNSSAKLTSLVTVTGALGDVRTKGGAILSYAQILANGPYVDLGMNVIEKVS